MDKDLFAVAIGASAGGVDALLQIAAALPARFPAPVLVTLHVGSLPSLLPELLRARGPNPAVHPQDGTLPLPGTIYIAPPDRHMLLEGGRIRLDRGPNENHCRPAIDPMFRSVALSLRSRAIGIVLTGQLDDGAAGLKAIKQCGGTAIVQDPATAPEAGMPLAALAGVDVDLCLDLAGIVAALERIVGAPPQHEADALPETLQRGQPAHDGRVPMENLSAIAGPFALNAGHPSWNNVRALQERESLLRRLARVARAQGDHAQADAGERQANRARATADELVRMIERTEGGA